MPQPVEKSASTDGHKVAPTRARSHHTVRQYLAALLVPLIHVIGLLVWLLAPPVHYMYGALVNPLPFSLATIAVCVAGLALAVAVLVQSKASTKRTEELLA
jgi:hypothetical protein